ncbi:hypothetical protein KC351_g7064 [Hortaea werneckii]|nr:hypothetical protein KC351_g7064 [Hortaea werneckii]
MTDNSTHLCGGEAPASTFDSRRPAVATPPQRVNLPLPRELRDQIYGYFLHHEYTEHSTYPESNTWDARLPSSYKFHTNILAVNTQIGAEAKEVLRSNDFVQVTTTWPVVKDLKAHEVPIVCDLGSRRLHFDHLRIDYKLHVHSLKILTDWERKFVVVRFGLANLCRIMQSHLLLRPSHAPIVQHGTNPKVNCQRHEEHSKIRSSIFVHDRVGKQLSAEKKRDLLEPFHNLIIGGQSMEVNKILPEHELSTFKLFVAPPVMNSLPMIWRLFEIALEMKAVADRHVLIGHFTKASRLYRHILSAVGAAARHEGSDTVVLYVLCALVFVDTCLCLALIDLTSSQPMDAKRWLRHSRSVLGRRGEILHTVFPNLKINPVKAEVASGRNVVIQWLSMPCGTARSQTPRLSAMVRHKFEQKKSFRAIMASNNHEQVAEYIDHDVSYLKSLSPVNDGTAAKQAFDKNKLSLFQFPPLVFNFPLPEEWSKPVGWFGFLDKEAYSDMLSKGLVSAP